MLLCSEILQSMRQFENTDKIFHGITTKILNLIQCGHIAIYELDGFIDNHNGMSPSGNIVGIISGAWDIILNGDNQGVLSAVTVTVRDYDVEAISGRITRCIIGQCVAVAINAL